MTLIEFLEARLDEDEEAAKNVHPGPWRAQPPKDQSAWDGGWEVVSDAYRPDQLGHPVVNVGDPVDLNTRRGGVVDQDHAAFIARHDPDRVLREVAAKRKAIGEAQQAHQFVSPKFRIPIEDGAGGYMLRLIAVSYADHPDYQDAWRL